MKHLIQRYPEVAQNQEFVNLLKATICGPSDFPKVIREVTVNNHRAGTVTAYLHSELPIQCTYNIVAESELAAASISNRTGLFCDTYPLAQAQPEGYHTTFGLGVPESVVDDDLLQLMVCSLLNFSNRALVLTAGTIKNSTKRHSVGSMTYRTGKELVELLQPTHHFYSDTTLVMAWFK